MAPGLPLTTEQQAAAIRIIWAARLVVLFPMTVSASGLFTFPEGGCTQSDPAGFQQDLAVLCHQSDHGNTAWRPSVDSPLWCRTADDRSDVLLFSLPCAGCACSHYLLMLLAVIPCGFFFGLVAPSATAETFRMEKLTGRFLMPMHSAFLLDRISRRLSGWRLFTPIGSAGSLGLSDHGWKWNVCELVTLEDLSTGRAPSPNPGASIALARPKSTRFRGTRCTEFEYDWCGARLVCTRLTRDMLVPMAYGGAIIFAFSLGEIAARLRGESLIQRLEK